jgi:hypothetical protein
VADLTALFKSNTQVTSADYGTDTRATFVSAIASSCPQELVGTGSGYLGELQDSALATLNAQVDNVLTSRNELSDKVAAIQKLVEKIDLLLRKYFFRIALPRQLHF